jgi:hypothetical protein
MTLLICCTEASFGDARKLAPVRRRDPIHPGLRINHHVWAGVVRSRTTMPCSGPVGIERGMLAFSDGTDR